MFASCTKSLIKKTVRLVMLVSFFCITNTAFAQTPNAPTGLNATQIGVKDFKLSWVASSSAGITGYEVFKDGTSYGTTNSTTTNLKIAGLTYGTSYTMTVKAKTATTPSDASAALLVTTFAALQVNTASAVPLIDGNLDAVWANGIVYTLGNLTRGTVTDDADLSGTFRLLADNNNLYVLAEIKDDISKANSTTEAWQNDGIEMYLDIGWQAPSTYGVNGFQFVFSASTVLFKEYKNNAIAGVTYKSKATLDGYRLEASIPWATIGGSGAAGTLFGFDMDVVDIDVATPGSFDAKKMWYGTIDDAYQFPYLLGVAKLTGSSVIDTQAPTAPTTLTSSAITPTSFTVTWTASTDNAGIAGYEIFNNGVSVGTTTLTSYYFTGIACASANAITIKAKDVAGNESTASATLNVNTSACDVLAPTAPSGLISSNITPASFTLTWTAATDNLGVTSYEIYRNGFAAGSTANLTFNLTGLNCETIYTITVKAKDAAGNSSTASTPLDVTTGICVDTKPPTPPTALVASAITAAGFTLSWTAATDNFAVTGYEIFKDGVSIGTSTATTFNVSGLICQRISLMTVKARDLAANISVASTPLNVTTSSCAVTYEAEDAVRTGGAVATNHPGYSGTGFWTNVTAQGNAVDFTVSAATAGNKDLSVRYATANSARTMTLYVNGVKVKQVTFAATANLDTWATITDAVAMNAGTNTIKYQFDTGDNGNVNIDYISFNGGAPDIDAPTIPTGLSYTANTAIGFTLNWNPSTDNYGVSEYEIFKDGVSAGTSATNTFDLTGLTCGFYKMTVKAKDAAGNASGLSSVLVAVTTPCADANALYVDTLSTSATEDGTFSNPFKSIQKAATVATSGKTVYVRKGLYREEIKMASDGVTYQPFNDEQVTITGTEQIIGWALQPGGNVYRAAMNFNADEANQLFHEGKMLNLVRWPKQTSADIINPSDAQADIVTASGNNFIIYDLQFNEPSSRWVGAEIWVNLSHNGVDGQGWTGKVVATSAAAHTITVNFRQPPILGNVPWGVGDNTQYYLFNPTTSGISSSGGINAILGKGEWFKTGTNLFVRTFNDQAPAETPTGANMVEAKKRTLSFHSSDPETNRSNYTIRGFNFFACTIVTDEKYKLRNIEVVEDAHDIVIENINMKYGSHFTDQTGSWQNQWSSKTGLVLSGRNNVLKNSSFRFSAGPAICMIGFGNKLLNNTVLDANYTSTNSGAINTDAVCLDCEIGHNIIRNTPLMAINFRGFKNSNPIHKGVGRIHHNIFSDALVRSWDSGVIDMVAQDGQWTRIDHNVIYNTTVEGKTQPARHGIYLDFGGGPDVYTGRYIVDHNVVYDISGPMLMNHIKQVNVYNNVFLSGVPTDNSIGNYNGGTGEEDTIRNNIMSNTPNIVCCSFGTLRDAVIENNIMDAQGATAANIFTDTTIHDYTLKATAIDAINTGIDFAPFNDPVVGPAVDLGAYEYGNAAWVAGPAQLPSPRILPNGGDFYDSAIVNIVSDSVGVGYAIRYTIDGSEPTASSPLYAGSIKLIQTAVVKTKVYAGTRFSSTTSASFTINVLAPGTILRDPENPLYTAQGSIRKYYEWDASLGYVKIPDLSVITPTRTDTVDRVGLYPPYRPDNFMLQFTGFIDIPANGIYKFSTASDDNSKFYIGNELIVDNDFLQAPTERSGSIGLKKGKHAFRAEFMETGGGEVFVVKFQGPGVTRQGFPSTALYYSSIPQADIIMSPLGGTFTDEVNVTISSNFAGTKVYYTTNGTDPTSASTLYTGPITIRNSLTLKAVVFIDGVKGASTVADFIIIPITGGPRAIIFPNPSEDGRFAVKFKNPGVGQVIGMFIFDARGRSVFQKNIRITTASSSQLEKFNLTFLKPGAYLVRLKTVSNEAGNLMDEEINLIVK